MSLLAKHDIAYREIFREADLISKSAVYHALRIIKQGPVRPEPKDSMSAWLMGRKVT